MEVNSAASECLFWGEARFAATRCQQGYLNYYFMIASWRFYDFSWETFTLFHHQHFPVSWRLERLIKISHLRELLMIPCCAWARAPRWQWTLHGHRSMSFHVVPCRSMSFRRYLMGEFGHLLPPSVTPRAKFEALHRHFVRGSQQTKAARAARARARALFRAALLILEPWDQVLTKRWPYPDPNPQIMDRAQLGDHRPSPGGDHSAGIREAPERKWSFVRGSRQLPEGNSGADAADHKETSERSESKINKL